MSGPPAAPAGAVAALLSASPLLVRPGPWALGAWPPSARGAVAATLAPLDAEVAVLLWDEREVSALVAEALLPFLPAPTRCERGFALLTLDAELPWDVVGVLAALAAALATAGIPVGAFAAYSRDHLVVPGARLAEALAALAPLCPRVSHLG